MLFTDIERSTRMLEVLGDESYALALAEHRRICREAFNRFGGTEVDTQGDSFFVVFERADEAAAAAEHAQAALGATSVRVRMGLHTGNPVVSDGMYVGLDVHRAARIAAVAHGCQIVLSATSAAELAGNPRLFSLGLHSLKDFAEPVELFQLGRGDHPPLRSIAPTNLPTPASAFIGRELELAHAGTIRTTSRLLTIVGPGGSGKTRFAVELARRTTGSFPGGTWFVSLSATTDPALVLPAIAAAMGIDDVGESPIDAIGRRSSTVSTSIVLDNLEQLTEAGADIARLVAEVANVSILATSRNPLFVTGEQVFELDVLTPADAVALFLERAKGSGRTIDAGGEIVPQLCARVDHLPLAIELIAARARIMSLPRMLATLTNPLDIESRLRDVPARHRTLRTTLQWSHALLSDVERLAFASLSVFADGWTIEAAEAVCECNVDVIQALIEHSLARVRFDIEGQSRSWMLELVRIYATEQLDEDRAEILRERLTTHNRRQLEIWSPQLNASEQLAAFAWFDAELADLRAGAHRLIDRNDPRAGSYLSKLHAYLWRRGRADEGNLLVALALTVSAMPDADRAVLHREAAVTALIAGDLATAQDHLERALTLIEPLEERELRLQLLASYGQLFMLRGETDAARDAWGRCRAEALEHGDHRVAALIDWNFGTLAASDGAWDDAAANFEASRSFHRSIDDSIGVAWLSGLLGWAHANRHDDASARSDLLAAFRTYERVGLSPGLESAMLGLAELLRQRSPAEAAQAVAWFDRLRADGLEVDRADAEQFNELRAELGPIPTRASGDAVECATWAIRELTD